VAEPSNTAHIDASCVWIVDGGPQVPEVPTGAPTPTCVIAVDSGASHALRLGLSIDVLVGDMDSIDGATRARLANQGVAEEEHSPEKDRSDLDLAIDLAVGLGASRIELISGGGGRLDHELVATLLLGRPEVAALPLTAHSRGSRITAVAAGTAVHLQAAAGDTVTLLAVGGAARVTTSELRWDLDDSTVLHPGSSLGLSNVALADTPHLCVSQGVVLAVVVPE